MANIIVIIYLLTGTLFAAFVYYLSINDEEYYKDRENLLIKKIDNIFIFFICTCLWIILLPIIIYNNQRQ